MKDAFVMSREELLAKTGTDSEKGLNPEQVEKSRSTYGTNSFVRQSHESLAKRIWDASTEPMLVMLIFCRDHYIGSQHHQIFYRRRV